MATTLTRSDRECTDASARRLEAEDDDGEGEKEERAHDARTGAERHDDDVDSGDDPVVVARSILFPTPTRPPPTRAAR